MSVRNAGADGVGNIQSSTDKLETQCVTCRHQERMQKIIHFIGAICRSDGAGHGGSGAILEGGDGDAREEWQRSAGTHAQVGHGVGDRQDDMRIRLIAGARNALASVGRDADGKDGLILGGDNRCVERGQNGQENDRDEIAHESF